jgi:hypothetical protein
MATRGNTGAPGERRRFLRRGLALAAGAAALPLLTTARLARADELPRLEEDNAQAQAPGYRHDASEADHPKREEGPYCNNCQLFEGSSDDEWADCQIFPGKAVAGKGWCTA